MTARTPIEPNSGLVTFGSRRGALLVSDAHGMQYRHSWDDTSERHEDRGRPLPPGDYTLTGYRIIKVDSDKKEWFLSATGRPILKFTVRRGETTRVGVPESVSILQQLVKSGDRFIVQASIRGPGRSGMSIYKEGNRIRLGYRISDAKGRELVRDDMTYG